MIHQTDKGLEYEYLEGKGTPLIFVHGWLGSIKSWELVRNHLDLENPMLYYSQRCHGNSKCENFDIETLARDLEEIIQDTEIENKPIIIGHSMGGMVALKFSTISDNFKALCLLGTCASTPEPEIGTPKYFLETYEKMDRDRWAEKITENYLGDTDNEQLKHVSQEELRNAHEKPVKKGLKAMINYDVRERLESENSIVVAGEKDGAITLEKSKELANILECNMKTIDSSHLMLHEQPDKIAQIITKFIQNYQ